MIDSKGYSGVPSIIPECIVAKKITAHMRRGHLTFFFVI
jgi:hypothetical protein